MPKASDPLCPLGFHPQTRWPNRCKRCFRDHSDHKSFKEQSGSNTSLNSLTSYDPATKQDDGKNSSGYGSRESLVSSARIKDEVEGSYRRAHSDMSAEILAKVNNEEDKWSAKSKQGSSSWNKSRPVSWSAQDLRAAVDEAKEQVRSSREDLHRLYGGSKSLSQDFGSLGDLRGSSNDLSEKDQEFAGGYSSFSSYLAMRTKSPARPPLSRTSSLQGTSSTSSSARREEEEEIKKHKEDDEKTKPTTTKLSTDSKTSKTPLSPSSSSSSSSSTSEPKPPKSILSTRSEGKTPLPPLSEGKKSLPSIKEGKSSVASSLSEAKSTIASIIEGKTSLGSISEGKTSISSTSEGKPPKPPSRLKPSTKLGDIKEAASKEDKIEKPRKNILSLRDDSVGTNAEVKSEDESVDASYVIQLSKPKKEPKRVEIDLQPEVDRLQKELKEKNQELQELTEKTEDLERENRDLLAKKPKFGKHTEVSKMQQKVDDLSDDMKTKNKEIKDLKKEIEKRPLPKDVEKTMEDLRSKLTAAEQLCEELMDENEDYKKEVRALEEEIEEMQDNFREEQADEYRDLKRELEQTAKNCRVLQFKLKKAERRADVLERDKGDVEEKLKDLQVGEGDVDRAEKVKNLEKEIDLAKEVSMKMHDEMERMRKQLETAEQDKKKLTELCKDKPNKPGIKYSRSQMMGRQGSQDNTEQLLRDLQDAGEREQDIKDQLKFAEEETKNLRKKLSRIEEENETLALQLKKMSNKAKADRQRSLERSGSTERSSSVERGQLSRQGSLEKPSAKEPDEGITEDLDPTELKIQLELNEQESAVLRRKVEDLESENERLQKEIKNVLSVPDTKTKKSDAGIDFKKLQKEVELMKMKVQDVETENERLHDENKKLQMKAVKRLPLSGAESSYIERQVLEEKARRLEKKLKDANEKLKAAQVNAAVTNSFADAKPGASSDADVGSLKKEVTEKESEISKMKKKMSDLQELYDKVCKDCEDMKNASAYKDRTPKKPKDLTPKSTLIKWVDELENECASLHIALKEAEKKKKPRPTSDDLTNVRDLEDKLERERERNDELSRQLKEEREKLEKPIGNKWRSAKTTSNEEDIRRYEERVESLKKELSLEKERNEELKSKMSDGKMVNFEELRAAQTEKHKLQKELSSAQQTTSILEKKLKETEENLKQSERGERKTRTALEKLESKLEDEKNSVNVAEERQKEMTVSWLKERDDLKKDLVEMKKMKEKVERDHRLAKKARDSMENKFEDQKKHAEEIEASWKKDKDNVKKLTTEKEELAIEIQTMKDTITQLEISKDANKTKGKRDMENIRKENEDLQVRMSTMESELKSEQKRRERLERESERGLKERTSTKAAESELKKVKEELQNVKNDYESKIKNLEKQKNESKTELEELHSKYELLEEEYVVQKAQLTTKKEDMSEDYEKLKQDHDTIEIELKTLRETYNIRQDTWIKEKLDMQEQLKSLENRLNKVSLDPTTYSEKKRLKDIIEDKNQQIDKLKRDEDAIKDQMSYYRREGEELRRKLDDLEKIQALSEKRTSTRDTQDTSTFDATIKDLKFRLTTSEKSHKSELTKIKMKYDSKLKASGEEVATLTQHMTKYRRERDTYKEMLDGAQRSIAELKGNTAFRASRADTASEAQQHLLETQELHSQVTELEDKLADARLSSTKMKNDLIDQKTNYEIQLNDLQTKLNEYEEDRLLGGGSRRVPGLRTRLELNWQKEREEQQRLIQETATLAKDLRQTLYEVERERDLERLEAKRKIEQLKKTVGQETTDTKTKVQELQRDLQELREAHAKLRQINEKLRREKDRTEVEREAMRDKFLGSSREHLNQQTKMEKLMDEMRKVKDLAPLVLGEGIDGRDSSLTRLPGDPKPKTKEEFTESLKRACRTMEEMKRMLNLSDDKDRLKRAPSFRRALSVEDSEDEGPPSRPRSAQRGAIKMPKGQRSTLYRKTQSLDTQMAEERGKIWVSTDAGSTTSIDSSMTDDMRRAKYDRDVSLDRISTGSQTSDLDVLGEKKKKTIKGVISKLTKSRSIEESATGGSIIGAGVKAMGVGVGGSGNDIPSDVEKDSVKGKIKGFFKKGPPTRSQSVDRGTDREGPNVREVASTFDYDTASMASISSLESNASANLPPVLRRARGRSSYGAMTKAQSFSAMGRQKSQETDV